MAISYIRSAAEDVSFSSRFYGERLRDIINFLSTVRSQRTDLCGKSYNIPYSRSK